MGTLLRHLPPVRNKRSSGAVGMISDFNWRRNIIKPKVRKVQLAVSRELDVKSTVVDCAVSCRKHP